MNRCPYCFKPLPANGICDCNYENSRNARIEDALQPGTILNGCYQVGAVIGKGGFGITYRCLDLDMERIVAIKEFFPSGMVVRGRQVSMPGRKSSDVFTLTEVNRNTYQKSLDLFYREARALSRLYNQPNVIHAFKIFRENGTAYIVMDFIEGESLSRIIRDRGRIPEAELLPLLDPILIALDKVHEAGIIHRDIAPDNIMIENGQPVLLDFGAARVDEGHTSSLLIGKKGYSSPEQVGGGKIDTRSDIYSMGATYYKALSGVTPQDSVLRMMNDGLVPLKELVPELSQRTCDAVMKAMSPNPDNRWKNAAEFRHALRKDEKGTIPADTQDNRDMPRSQKNGSEKQSGKESPRSEPQQAKKAKKSLWLIPVLLLVLCAAGYFLFRSDQQKKANETATQTALSLIDTQSAQSVLDTQSALDAENTRSALSLQTEQAVQTASAWEQETQTALREAQTATAWKAALEEEMRQTSTQEAEYAAETRTAEVGITEEAVRIETLSAAQTQQVIHAEQTSTAFVSTREAEFQQTQTQSALELSQTRAVQEQMTAAVRQTETALAFTKTAELHQTQTQESINLSSTQAAYEQQTEQVRQTETAQTATREAELRQTETRSAADIQNTQSAFEREQQTSEAAEATRVMEEQRTATQAALEGMLTETAAVEQTLAVQMTATRSAEELGLTRTAAVERTMIAELTVAALEQIRIELEQTESAFNVMETEAAYEETRQAMEMRMTGVAATKTKAAEPTATPTPEATRTPTLTATPAPLLVSAGDVITIGHYEQDNNWNNGAEEIEWQVLTVEEDRALLISKYALEVMAYNEWDTEITWEQSTLRKWLNEEFFETAFSAEEQARIPVELVLNPENERFWTFGGNATDDRVFLLSSHEADKYFSYSNEARVCQTTAYAEAKEAFISPVNGNVWWWLRTPGAAGNMAAGVDPDGSVFLNGIGVDSTTYLVRPAFWLDLTVTVTPTTVDLPQEKTAVPVINTEGLRVGDEFPFGVYEQDNDFSNGAEPIEWQVLAVEDHRALLISKYILDAQPYNETKTEVTWETSSLREWLNGDFRDTAFSSDEKARIYSVINSNLSNPFSDADGGRLTGDQIFLLSIDEAFQYFEDDDTRKCSATAYAKANGAFVPSYWWLRSPGWDNNNASSVGPNGYVFEFGDSVASTDAGVRPAFWLDLTVSTAAESFEPPQPTDTNTPQPTATPTPQPTSTNSPTPTDTPQPTATPTPQPTSTNTPSPTDTPQPTVTPTPQPTFTNTPISTSAAQDSFSLKVGDTFIFGQYEQDNDFSNGTEPIEWQVLAVEDDRALVISRYGLDMKRYSEEWKRVNWEMCTLRTWLNGTFYNTVFSPEEKRQIIEVTNENPDNPKYGTKGGNQTKDRIFLLSIDEAEQYFSSDEARKCYATDYAKANGAWVDDSYGTSLWLLRSRGHSGINAANVRSDGSVSAYGDDVYHSDVAMRPAFWLDLSGEIEPVAVEEPEPTAEMIPTYEATETPTEEQPSGTSYTLTRLKTEKTGSGDYIMLSDQAVRSTPSNSGTVVCWVLKGKQVYPQGEERGNSSIRYIRIKTEEGREGWVNKYSVGKDAQLITAGSEEIPSADLKAGDIFLYGQYEQDNDKNNGMEAIEWQVLALEKDRALVISRYGLDAKPYNEKHEGVTWKSCTLRKWLNEYFFDFAFSSEEKGQIRQVTLQNSKKAKYETADENTTIDRIFLLSIDDVNQYFSNDEARKCWPTTYAVNNGALIDENYGGTTRWWLRRLTEYNYMSDFIYVGSVSYGGADVDSTGVVVRPAFWLDLSGEMESSLVEDPKPITELIPTSEPTETPTEEQPSDSPYTLTLLKTEITGSGDYIMLSDHEVRSAPKFGGTVVCWVLKGKQVYPQGEEQDDFIRIKTAEGREGWVYKYWVGKDEQLITAGSEKISSADLKVGDIFLYGQYEQDNDKNNGMEAIEWQVLAVEKGRALVISRYGLDAKPYNEKYVSVTWETCTLRAWLNGEFYDTAFSPEEKRQIIEMTNENPDDPKYGTKGGSRTKDRIFLLSIDEAEQYFSSTEERKCYATDYANENGAYVSDSYGGTSWWWLRSPGSHDSYAANVYDDGSVTLGGPVSYDYGVARPAFWLNTSVTADIVETQISQDENTIELAATLKPTATKPPQPTAVPLRVGDMIKFGRYEQDNNKSNGMEPIKWQVLAVENSRALIISRYGLDAKPYNEEWKSITWETSTLRAWLNGEFYDTAFSPEEKRQVIEVTNENPDNPEYGTQGGNRTKDRIFLLSIDEVIQYFSSNEERKCYATDYAKVNGANVFEENGGTSWCWLRSPGYVDHSAADVNNDGSVNLTGYSVFSNRLVARPAFWLNL